MSTVLLPPPPAPAADWALFLDVDGCLLEFAPTPDAVIVPPGLPGTLTALQRRLDGALALVSGRSLAALDRIFEPLRLTAAGLHGLERRAWAGEVHAPRRPAAFDDVLDDAHALARRHPGVVVEDKGVNLGLHWRLAPEAAGAVAAFAEAALLRLPGYRLQPGDHVVELRPEGAHKGTAIAAFLAEPPFAGRVPVFAGDDRTDEYGFEVVNAHGGISILVGDRPDTAARHALADPAAVRRWLASGG
ncbi:trehalose-phosphatase [Coralloluteibacterium thermophilus]|uniref:Trehalose 6-phosphate phosphatase n=1 Tax=Coralloluteibacterium thermophilum TaxID=2707049 RepID=A0ABV9NEJ8_9GAMM